MLWPRHSRNSRLALPYGVHPTFVEFFFQPAGRKMFPVDAALRCGKDSEK